MYLDGVRCQQLSRTVWQDSHEFLNVSLTKKEHGEDQGDRIHREGENPNTSILSWKDLVSIHVLNNRTVRFIEGFNEINRG